MSTRKHFKGCVCPYCKPDQEFGISCGGCKKLKGDLLMLIDEVQQEINGRPKSSNIGKRGCIVRLQKILLDNL